MRYTVVSAGLLVVLVFGVVPSSAQLTPIVFPDTTVGATSTITCPSPSAGLCFGTNCTGSGTVQGVTGPNLPFGVGHFTRLSSADFFAGNCDVNPVSLPVTLNNGQILGFHATFSPTAAGSFTSTMTFSPSGGSGSTTLSGRGISAPPTSTRPLITIEANQDTYVPGNAFELTYHTTPGTSQTPIDLYFAVQLPTGQLFFLTNQGALTPAPQPLRRNVTVIAQTQTLVSFFVPTDFPFGTYTCFMGLGVPGTTPDPNNLQPSLAAPVAQATLTYAPLSPIQQSILQSRGGNPDLLATIWLPDAHQNRASWSYFSGNPIRFTFLNGNLVSQQALSTPPTTAGPRLDPSLLTPQTNLTALTAAFGSPTSVGPNADAPEFTEVHYAFGLDVTLLSDHLSSATTSLP